MGEANSEDSSNSIVKQIEEYRNKAVIQSLTADTPTIGNELIASYRQQADELLKTADESTRESAKMVMEEFDKLPEHLGDAKPVFTRANQVHNEYKSGKLPYADAKSALADLKTEAESSTSLYQNMLSRSIDRAVGAIDKKEAEKSPAGSVGNQPQKPKPHPLPGTKSYRSKGEIQNDLDQIVQAAKTGELTEEQKIKLNELELETHSLGMYQDEHSSIINFKTQNSLEPLDRSIEYRKKVADQLAERVVENLKSDCPALDPEEDAKKQEIKKKFSRWLTEEFDKQISLTNLSSGDYRHGLTNKSAEVYQGIVNDREGFLKKHGYQITPAAQPPSGQDGKPPAQPPAQPTSEQKEKDLNTKLRKYGELADANKHDLSYLNRMKDEVDKVVTDAQGDSDLTKALEENPVPGRIRGYIKIHEQGKPLEVVAGDNQDPTGVGAVGTGGSGDDSGDSQAQGVGAGDSGDDSGDGKNTGKPDDSKPGDTAASPDLKERVLTGYQEVIRGKREQRGIIIPEAEAKETDDERSAAYKACDREDAEEIYAKGEELGLRLAETPYMKLVGEIDDFVNKIRLSDDPEQIKEYRKGLITLRDEARKKEYSEKEQGELQDLIEKGEGLADQKQKGLLKKIDLDTVLGEIFIDVSKQQPYFTDKREIFIRLLEKKISEEQGVVKYSTDGGITNYDYDKLKQYVKDNIDSLRNEVQAEHEKTTEPTRGEKEQSLKGRLNALRQQIKEDVQEIQSLPPKGRHNPYFDDIDKYSRRLESTYENLLDGFTFAPNEELEARTVRELDSLRRDIERTKSNITKSTQAIGEKGTIVERERMEISKNLSELENIFDEMSVNCDIYLGFENIHDFIQWDKTPIPDKTKAESTLLEILFKNVNREDIRRQNKREVRYNKIAEKAEEHGFRCPEYFHRTPETDAIMERLSRLERELLSRWDEKSREEIIEITQNIAADGREGIRKVETLRHHDFALINLERQIISTAAIEDEAEFRSRLDFILEDGMQELQSLLRSSPDMNLERYSGKIEEVTLALRERILRSNQKNRNLRKYGIGTTLWAMAATAAAVYLAFFAKPEKVEVVKPIGPQPRIAALEAEKSGLQEKLNGSEAARKGLQQKFDKMNENVEAEVKKRISDVQTKNTELEDRVKSLQGELDKVNEHLKNERTASGEKKVEYQAQTAKLQTELADIAKQLEAQKAADAENKKQLAEQGKALKESEAAKKKAEQGKETVRKALEKRLDQVQEELRKENERLRKRVPIDLNSRGRNFLRNR